MDVYQTAMALELDSIDEERVKALNNIFVQNKIAAKEYNKRVKSRTFNERDLVWKTILPLNPKTQNLGNGLQNGKDLFKFIKFLREDFII